MNERKLALGAFGDIVRGGAYANLRLKLGTDSGTNDRFVKALVYSVLEKLLRIDGILEAYVGKKTDPLVFDLLRLGTCELLYMDTPAHAVVNEYVSLAKSNGRFRQAGFVNAVLRRIDRERNALPPLPSDPWKALSVDKGYPLWIISRWRREYGDETAAALVNAAPLSMSIRAQYPALTEQIIPLLPCDYTLGKLDMSCIKLSEGFDPQVFPPFLSGECTVQGEGAMLACRALGNCAGLRVLDACAAPGGKSAYVASLSENRASIVAWEKHPHRAELLEKTLDRLHVQAEIRVKDATELDECVLRSFDRVLLDVPCSGLGLLAGKPDLRFGKTEEDIESLVPIQRDILECCCRYLKPGGILVYSTCTVSLEENDRQVEAFLKRHKDFIPDPLPFAEDWKLQLMPHLHGTEGFFIARMKYVPDRAVPERN